ncbi:hypothetical protein [Oceanicella actignis]|uniref:hypothetical protein n=1 Tax=Oceanicella actignis TaxID=1189325 RepID=UPI0011E7CCAF|nr:hypothetical protein [Oceanicella actignis]TYO91446.1 hypothetical protein LY05_00299 [Oceanicella actignis]
MSNLHADAVRNRLMTFLRRRSIPRHLAGNEEAIAAEIESLVRRIAAHAPRSLEALDRWWPQFERRLELTGNGRSWPVAKEIADAAAKTPLETTGERAAPDIGSHSWRLQIVARRIRNGEAVGEMDLWGETAVELVNTGMVFEGDIERYREVFAARLIEHLGEDAALKALQRLEALHAGAQAAWLRRSGRAGSRLARAS